MKKKLFGILVAVLIMCMAVQGTVAYFTANTTAHNVITTGEIDIALVETMEKDGEIVPYPTDPVEGIVPGMPQSKIVNVENVGTNPAWVRVKVVVKVNGDAVEVNTEDSLLTIDFDSTVWKLNGGYYYYTKVLTPDGTTGDSTALPLFTTVTMRSGAGNEYQNAKIEINITAEGIQYENNTNFNTAWPKDIPILPFI